MRRFPACRWISGEVGRCSAGDGRDPMSVDLDILEQYRIAANELSKGRPEVIFYRGWANFPKGKLMTEVEGPSPGAVRNWFTDLKLPPTDVFQADLIGQAGMATLAP